MGRFLVLLAVCGGATAREIVEFDSDWQFQLGDAGYAPPCNTSAFSTNLSGSVCDGGTGTLIFVSTRELCEQACCGDPRCTYWEWCEQPCLPASPGWGCKNGYDSCPTRSPAQNWTAMARAAPRTPPPTPAAVCTDPAQPCAPGFPDSGWRTVTTPHDFVVEGAYAATNDEEHGFLPWNVSWYRRRFSIEAAQAGSAVWVDFDGVYKNSDVWLNGVYLGHHTSGYVAFRYFLHNATQGVGAARVPVLRYGGGTPNVLAVRVDALSVQEGWFYEGGGIYRHVTLTIADPVHISPWGVYLPSAVTGAITSGPLGALGPQTAASASVMPQTDVTNSRAVVVLFALTTTVLDPNGTAVGVANSSGTLPPGAGGTLFQEVRLSGPVQLWNTAARPPLYTVNSTLWIGGAAVDTVTTVIGIRSAVWTPTQGFQLNGVPTPLQGFSNHQSWAGCGNAVPTRVDEYRITSLKEVGANLWRMSYPGNAQLTDLADAHGMLMWVENRMLRYAVQPVVSTLHDGAPRCNPTQGLDCAGGTDQQTCTAYYVPCSVGSCNCEWSGAVCAESVVACAPAVPSPDLADPQLLQDIHDMVLRDRNHPSVIIWCLCNEVGCDIGDADGGVFAAQFKAAINAADTTRPITANTEWTVGSQDTLTTVLDVMSCSYNYGTYELYHKHHPFRPFMGGESASCTSDRGYYGPTNATRGLLNGDAAAGCAATSWMAAASTEWASGSVAWTGHDYKGEPGAIGWPDINSHFGVYDIAGFEKDRGGYYRSWWLSSGASFVRVSPRDWTAPVAVGAPVQVAVFTGAAAAEVFLNGVSVGGRKPVPPFGFADFGAVKFAPGNLTAVAYTAAGAVVGFDSVVTVGAAVALRLSLEDDNGRPYVADGQDVALVRCAVVDAAGQVVPGASNAVTFTVDGPGAVYGVGNGDPANHTPDKVGLKALPYGGVWVLPAYMGLARAIVATVAGQPGQVVLRAVAPGLVGAQVAFTTH
jgi:beta-galactosidase